MLAGLAGTSRTGWVVMAEVIDWERVLGVELAAELRPELPDLEAAALAPSPRSIRLRPGIRDDQLPFATQKVPWFSAGRVVTDPEIRPGQFLQHAAGDYYVQDAGSMLALALCEIQPWHRVCDVCAAPGGKSTGLLEQLGNPGVLVANEVISSRLPPLKQALERSGRLGYIVMNREVEQLAELGCEAFDCVLVDAPCTGQSMVGKAKQSQSAFAENQIRHSAARQDRILRSAGHLVRPGGRLVYSTCTFSYRENEQVIRQFLALNPGWEKIRFPRLAAWQCRQDPGCYRLWPHRDRCSGAFGVCLRKVDSSAPRRASRTAGLRQPRWQPVGQASRLPDWLKAASGELLQCRDEIHSFPPEAEAAWIEASLGGSPIAKGKASRTQSRGRTVALKAAADSPGRRNSPSRSHPFSGGFSHGVGVSHWQPLFAFSRTIKLTEVKLPTVELDDLHAARFVAGESIRCESERQGWALAIWRGRVLSWGKLSSGLLKNHFPKGLRQQIFPVERDEN